MSAIPKEVIRELIKEQKFSNTTEVMEAIKDMFRDVLQEVMEAELETELGYEKQARRSENVENDVSKNYRNGYSKKTIKTQIGEVEINIPRDRNGKYEPISRALWTCRSSDVNFDQMHVVVQEGRGR